MIDTNKKIKPIDVSQKIRNSLPKRHFQEKKFKFYGQSAVTLAIFFLFFLFYLIFTNGIPGLFQHYVTLNVYLDSSRLDPRGDFSDQSLFSGDASKLIYESLYKEIEGVDERSEKKIAKSLVSSASDVRLINHIKENPELLNSTHSIQFAVDDDVDSFLRGYISRDTPEEERRLSNLAIQYIDSLNSKGLITYEFSDYLFLGSASREAEIAGIKGALVGSILTMLICLSIAFPLGIMTAIYLEEIAPKNWFTELIEININNLAAVPSVVFGIMGLAIFIVAFGLPRSIPLVGGIVLALMTLPTVIISSRAAIKAVPPSIREAAYGIGASKMQMVFHHVLPLAMPGMLTGTIIGMAQALGETAPLLMIGMVAFIVDIPGGVAEPSTALPVQIFMWADFAERMFVHKTSAAIIVLLAFLLLMNFFAVMLRKKLEKRW